MKAALEYLRISDETNGSRQPDNETERAANDRSDII